MDPDSRYGICGVFGGCQKKTCPSHQKMGGRNDLQMVVDIGVASLSVNNPYIQDGAPKIAKLPNKWLYGRYTYSKCGYKGL